MIFVEGFFSEHQKNLFFLNLVFFFSFVFQQQKENQIKQKQKQDHFFDLKFKMPMKRGSN